MAASGVTWSAVRLVNTMRAACSSGLSGPCRADRVTNRTDRVTKVNPGQ